MDRQYTISEFAALNKITARMLRHYDKIGLLKPVSIQANGYRVYTSAQVPVVSQIRRYQNCGFSLTETGELLLADEDMVRRGAKDKMRQLELQEKEDQMAWEELAQLSQAVSSAFENHYDISFVEQSEQVLFCSNRSVLEDEIEDGFNELYHALLTAGAAPAGHLLLLSDMKENPACHVAVPVKSRIQCEGYQCIKTEKAWYLSTFHYGPYYNIGMAYDRLLCYAGDAGYTLEFPFVERYYVDLEYTKDSTQYITQVMIKIN